MINVRVDVGADKTSDKTRISRAEVVGNMATTIALYQTDASFKNSVDKMVSAGASLAAAESQINQIEAAMIKARSTRDVRRNAFDKAHGICATNVEGHSMARQPGGADRDPFSSGHRERRDHADPGPEAVTAQASSAGDRATAHLDAT